MQPKFSELPEVSLLEAFKIAELDLTKLLYFPSAGTDLDIDEFQISPIEFLRYAKAEFHSKTTAGLVNGISNAKRAIDCQIDVVLASLIGEWVDLPKSLEVFTKCFNFDGDLSYKLKVIQSLNLAPSTLIAEARTHRHELEHNYQVPVERNVKRAIDIAEIFIRSIDSIFKARCCDFELTDMKNLPGENQEVNYWNGLEFTVGGVIREQHTIMVQVTRFDDGHRRGVAKVILKPDNPLYFAVFRLLFSEGDDFELTESVKVIAKLAGHQMPLEHIKVEGVF